MGGRLRFSILRVLILACGQAGRRQQKSKNEEIFHRFTSEEAGNRNRTRLRP
jgi:hypothetical protein